MKLPRWLVIAMLTTSVLSVLAAAGWWWVTWPERTAREFEGLWNGNKRELTIDLFVSEQLAVVFRLRKEIQKERDRYRSDFGSEPFSEPKVTFVLDRRSWVDVLTGRAIALQAEMPLDYVTIMRGTIVDVGYLSDGESCSVKDKESTYEVLFDQYRALRIRKEQINANSAKERNQESE